MAGNPILNLNPRLFRVILNLKPRLLRITFTIVDWELGSRLFYNLVKHLYTGDLVLCQISYYSPPTGDWTSSQIPWVCPPLPHPPLGLNIDKCISDLSTTSRKTSASAVSTRSVVCGNGKSIVDSTGRYASVIPVTSLFIYLLYKLNYLSLNWSQLGSCLSSIVVFNILSVSEKRLWAVKYWIVFKSIDFNRNCLSYK